MWKITEGQLWIIQWFFGVEKNNNSLVMSEFEKKKITDKCVTGRIWTQQTNNNNNKLLKSDQNPLFFNLRREIIDPLFLQHLKQSLNKKKTTMFFSFLIGWLLPCRVQTCNSANEVGVVFLYGRHYAGRRVVDPWRAHKNFKASSQRRGCATRREPGPK